MRVSAGEQERRPEARRPPLSAPPHPPLSAQDCEILHEVCGWINAKATVPVWAKMTPNVTGAEGRARGRGGQGTSRVLCPWAVDRCALEQRPPRAGLLPTPRPLADISMPAHAALAAGCDGIAAINTITSVMGINLDSLRPEPCGERPAGRLPDAPGAAEGPRGARRSAPNLVPSSLPPLAVEGHSTPGGYSSKAVKPIALAKCMAIAQVGRVGRGAASLWGRSSSAASHQLSPSNCHLTPSSHCSFPSRAVR